MYFYWTISLSIIVCLTLLFYHADVLGELAFIPFTLLVVTLLVAAILEVPIEPTVKIPTEQLEFVESGVILGTRFVTTQYGETLGLKNGSLFVYKHKYKNFYGVIAGEHLEIKK